MKMLSHLIRFSALACCGAALTIAGCGDKGHDKVPPSEIINGISVPPDPGPGAKSTLQGVDVNRNGVRDEVERALASSYGNDTPAHASAMKTAAFDQKWLSQPASLSEAQAQSLVIEALRHRDCLVETAGLENGQIISQEVALRTFNTRERMAERERIFDAASVFEVADELEDVC